MNDCTLYEHPLYPDYRFDKKGKVYTKYHASEWREMKTVKSRKKNPYFQLTLKDKNGIRKNRLVHRIIAELFIPNPQNYPCINHKDENGMNNAADNLEWCTYQYNNTYGHRLEKAMSAFLKAAEEHCTPVIGIDSEGKEYYFKSQTEAAKFIRRGRSTMGRHIRSGRPCGGYIFKLAERKETYA